jgi:ribosomal protein S18 acetylase RimI-like enzyme
MSSPLTPNNGGTGVVIREALETEVSRVYAMTHAAFLEYAADVPPPSALFETEAEIREEMQRGAVVLIAELENNVPAGCIRYRRERDTLYFFRLAVLPSARRKGVASALLTEVEHRAIATNCTRIRCNVRTQVTKNVALYEHRGYVLVGEEIKVRGGFALRVGVMEKMLG